MERKLKFLESEIKKDGIRMNDTGESPDAPPPREMSDLESTFEKLEQELQEVRKLWQFYFKNYVWKSGILGEPTTTSDFDWYFFLFSKKTQTIFLNDKMKSRVLRNKDKQWDC